MNATEADRLFHDMMSHVPVGGVATAALLVRMRDDARHYHDIRHTALLWQRHLLFQGAAEWASPLATQLIACAIAYHDAVYDVRRYDNEARSADLWMEISAGCSIEEVNRLWVASTIRATADHLAYDDDGWDGWRSSARTWMVDLDVTPLGETPDVFAGNTALLRAEVPHLTDEQYDAARLSFLQRFHAAPRIYRAPALAAHFEAPARRNIARQLYVSQDQGRWISPGNMPLELQEDRLKALRDL